MLKQTKDGQKNLSQTAELLTITVILSNSTNLPHSVVKDTVLFQPLQWKRISGTHGKGLLQLKPVYEMLSLSLLSFKTRNTYNITIRTTRMCREPDRIRIRIYISRFFAELFKRKR